MSKNTLVEQYYDNLASRYDTATMADGAWSPPTQVAKAIERLSQSFDSVFVIGIGTGHDLSVLPTEKPLVVEGIDVSREMLEICRGKYPSAILHHGDFMKESAYSKEKYDLIVCSGTLEFIEDFEGFFEKCSSMLNDKGAMLLTYEPIVFGHQWQKDFESDTLGEKAEESGFSGFKTYRRSIFQYQQATESANLSTIEHYSFVSYKKSDVDIVYNFAVCQPQ